MTNSLTTALEEMNEQLRRENDVLKTEIEMAKDELKTNNDKQKDDITQLITLLNKMAVNNENQMQQINSQSSENSQLRAEVQKLKVSQWHAEYLHAKL